MCVCVWENENLRQKKLIAQYRRHHPECLSTSIFRQISFFSNFDSKSVESPEGKLVAGMEFGKSKEKWKKEIKHCAHY